MEREDSCRIINLWQGPVKFCRIASSSIVETTILRAQGQLYQTTENGNIRNLYTFQVVNKTNEKIPIKIKLKSPEGQLTLVGENLEVKGSALLDGAFFLEFPKSILDGLKTDVLIEIYSEGKLLEEVSTTFMGPIPKHILH